MSIFEYQSSNFFGKVEAGANEFVLNDPENEEPQIKRSNFNWFSGLVILMFITFFARLAFLQIAQGASHSLLAEGNRVRSIEIQPPRGTIYDRNGEILAKNIPEFGVQIL